MNIQFILAVAAGGALGSVMRYLVGIGSGRAFGTDFPWGTLIINVTGSFLIGTFVALFATKWNLPQAARVSHKHIRYVAIDQAYQLQAPGVRPQGQALEGLSDHIA